MVKKCTLYLTTVTNNEYLFCRKRYALGDVCDEMSAYSNLTDEVFHRILLAEEGHDDLRKAKQILNDILSRRLYAFVGHTQPSTEKIVSTVVKELSYKCPWFR